MCPTQLFFGTAGIPLSTEPRNTAEGIKQVRSLGLGAMELEFVQSVNISETTAPAVKKVADGEHVILTCHGQYYINLSSLEPAKCIASIQRVLNAAQRAWQCGAYSVTFHPGFYQGRASAEVYPLVKTALQEVIEKLNQENNRIWVRPETTGKPTQFGTVDEILQLSQELEQVMPCIDFSHLHARTNGKENSYNEFCTTLQKVEDILGKEGLRQMHIHVSGIAYGPKGEKHHLILQESDFNYRDLCKALKEFNCKGVVICESPNIEDDALLLQKTYDGL